MKKGIAIGEFEKIVEKTMIFHEILLKIQEIDPQWRQETSNVRKWGAEVSKSEPKGT